MVRYVKAVAKERNACGIIRTAKYLLNQPRPLNYEDYDSDDLDYDLYNYGGESDSDADSDSHPEWGSVASESEAEPWE